jgi:beta-glucanase (GH16 family)
MTALPVPRTTCAIWMLALLTLSAPAPAYAQNWVLVWSDEFDGAAGTGPDPANWTYDIGTGFGTGEIEHTTDSRDNSFIDGNGNLVIKAIKDQSGLITSARIKTKRLFEIRYGRIEARIKLPYSQGMWPAFWMLGNNIDAVSWPRCGEIDIMENIGRTPSTTYGTIHGPQYANQGLGRSYTLPDGQQLHDDYHIFGTRWSPYQIEFYMDDVVYATLARSSLMYGAEWPFYDHPFFLIFDLAVGGPWAGNPDTTTVWPQLMSIDYVRAYQWTPGPAAPGNLTAAAISNSQIQLNWDASATDGVGYNVYRGTDPNFLADITSLIATDVTLPAFSDVELTANTAYFYQVTATGSQSAESDPGGPAGDTTLISETNGGAILIDAGGYGVENFAGDVDFAGGNTNAFTSPIDTSGVTDPAPEHVYQTERWGASTYTIATLTPGASYRLRLHFCETSFNAANQRTFNVAVNGERLLTEFDVFAAAGGKNKAVVREFSVSADDGGQLMIQFLPGSHNNPSIRGIELIPAGPVGPADRDQASVHPIGG